MAQQPATNGVAQPQLLLVGSEITYLEQLIDETPTRYGKHFLTLLSAVRQKRAAELREAQALFQQQEEAKKKNKSKNVSAPEAPKA